MRIHGKPYGKRETFDQRVNRLRDELIGKGTLSPDATHDDVKKFELERTSPRFRRMGRKTPYVVMLYDGDPISQARLLAEPMQQLHEMLRLIKLLDIVIENRNTTVRKAAEWCVEQDRFELQCKTRTARAERVKWLVGIYGHRKAYRAEVDGRSWKQMNLGATHRRLKRQELVQKLRHKGFRHRSAQPKSAPVKVRATLSFDLLASHPLTNTP